ncbi:hypothetical protein HMPREF1210_02934 [Paenisporosarcina sp. HGH0030]|uniref:DUF4083 domain-containing protein n=1 Tax=Paenisporosarcina sp. HGH0030 TaxID=1078085 RepID=UPI00034E8B1C|nr:DUF4083 domain-containing protein [Paenisporosarcina sp. HGH0030]EPD50363.1 hypothetical protein HMPREF1210_02934 [Paenisporosarcina sp. HGH0030]
MDSVNFFSIFYIFIVIGLIVIFILSFSLFIRRIRINSAIKSNHYVEIDQKLDKIIELLEKKANV